jgi:DNA-binding transcriptional regulator GbsR (MarR family)
MATPRNIRIIEAETAAAEAVGDAIEHWGFRRALGRMWATLYVASEPLSATDLAERLCMSAGAVSTTIAELRRWDVIKRVWRPGERRELYEAETDLWRMVANVVREREGLIAASIRGKLESAIATVESAKDADGDAALERLKSLAQLARTGEAVLSRVSSLPLNELAALARVVEAMHGAGRMRSQKSKQQSGGAV